MGQCILFLDFSLDPLAAWHLCFPSLLSELTTSLEIVISYELVGWGGGGQSALLN